MSGELDFAEPDLPVGGYRIDLEDRKGLVETSTECRFASFGDIPERVDIRKSPWYANGWLKVENQGSIGSCAGNALTECGEFCFGTQTGGKVIQLSRMYAYIRTQQFDGIRTDSGSTLSGGTKAAKEGICLENIAPYPSRYPGWGWITDAMREQAKNYRLATHTVIRSSDEVRSYIGSGIGIVQIGIAWNSSMNPDANGCIRRWSAGGGGHSVTITGYVPDSDVGQRSSKGWWALMKNSWGTRWGVSGFAYVDPAAIDQMLRHSWTVFIGRSDMEVPGPRNIDWTKEKVFA